MRSTLITVCCLAFVAALTLAGQTTQSEPLKPAASPMFKITNADVVQLVTARRLRTSDHDSAGSRRAGAVVPIVQMTFCDSRESKGRSR